MANPSRLSASCLLPVQDLLNGLDRCLDSGFLGLLAVAGGLAAGWWLYVPIHELLHAAACLATGGTISRLEIDPIYGGNLLAKLSPSIVSASAYAGRLSGFDTRGSDWIYLATDLGPFLLALFPGSWLLRRAARSRRSVLLGFALPFALAPFLSLTGDAYEIGSILVTRLPPWASRSLHDQLRGDDLVLKIQDLASHSNAPWGGVALSALTGLAWAFLTYGLGSLLATALGEKALGDHNPGPAR